MSESYGIDCLSLLFFMNDKNPDIKLTATQLLRKYVAKIAGEQYTDTITDQLASQSISELREIMVNFQHFKSLVVKAKKSLKSA